MKTFSAKYCRLFFLITGLFIITISACSNNFSETRSSTTVVISDSNWVFTAVTVSPQYGNNGPVNGNYRVKYSGGTLNIYLPYFGRAYGGADVISGKNPLDFISKDFTVSKEQVKKDGQEIIFTPKDNNEVISLRFTIYSSGNAYLNVTMNNRSSISFTGNVR